MKKERHVKKSGTLFILFALFVFMAIPNVHGADIGPLTIDHNHIRITEIPETAINQAKADLHIAYGHTSHGSQLTTGMSGLVSFMNGLGYTQDLYAYNSGGSGGALDLRDTPFSGASDLGNPNRTAWATATRNYLNSHPEVNVIIWSWCGQVNTNATNIQQHYLNEMNTLEQEYPDVYFVYMTGHLNGTGETGTVNQRNQQIRDYCTDNNKILFDFADIESYDPDGLENYMQLMGTDTCAYDSDGNGSRDANWATAWQNSHTEGEDWYSCYSAHSQPLNANMKAFAAWHLWARLAGWDGGTTPPPQDDEDPTTPENLNADAVSSTTVDLSWSASTDNNRVAGYRIYRDGTFITANSGTSYQDSSLDPGTQYSYQVSAYDPSGNESDLSTPAVATTEEPTPDTTAPSTPENMTASAVSSSQIDITWSASTDNVGVTGYEIYRNNVLIDSTTGTSYSDSGLSPTTEYSYHVIAGDAAGNPSEASDSAAATTLDPSQETYTIRIEGTQGIDDAFLKPNCATNFGSVPYTSGPYDFMIKFILPPEVMNKNIIEAKAFFYVYGQSGYQAGQHINLYKVTSDWEEGTINWNSAENNYDASAPVAQIPHEQGCDHDYYPPGDITAQVQRWADSIEDNFGLRLRDEGATSIRFKASEYSKGPYLEITYSDSSSPSLPQAPGAVVCTPGDGQVNISWDASPSPEIAQYNIYRGTTPDNMVLIDETDSTQLSYTDLETSCETTYHYAVSAHNSVGEGPRASADPVTTENCPGNTTDVNDDGITDVIDAMACINVILGVETNADIIARSDVNNDGSVNVQDAIEIVNVILQP